MVEKVGVLAFQGCIEPHVGLLRKLGVTPVRVVGIDTLATVSRLILPGGESTTMLKFLKEERFLEPLKQFCRTQPVWGICAGAILLAQEVCSPLQESLGVIDIRATRNFYGSQLDSFKTHLFIEPLDRTMEVDFIRAPKLEALNTTVQTLAHIPAEKSDGAPVMFRQKSVLVTAFHTELGDDTGLHEYFLGM